MTKERFPFCSQQLTWQTFLLIFFWPFGNLGITISTSALALAKIYFCLTKCFMKNHVKYTQIFFLALSQAASISFCYNYSFRLGLLPYHYQNTQSNICGGVHFKNICWPSWKFKLRRSDIL